MSFGLEPTVITPPERYNVNQRVVLATNKETPAPLRAVYPGSYNP